jgi:uncharacterized protein (TIGR02246 family)
MSADPATAEVAAVLDAWHAAFAAGDADRFAALFTEDARLCLLHRETVEGRDAIRGYWASAFARLDTSAWQPLVEQVDVHGDRAYAFGTYTERLLSREDGSRTLVRGRLVHFLRRDRDGAWRVALLVNSHSHPMEPLA